MLSVIKFYENRNMTSRTDVNIGNSPGVKW